MKPTDAQIIEALEQACKEESFGLSALDGYINGDAGGCAHWGGLAPRVSIILGASEQLVRRRLAKMHKKGVVLRYQSRKSGPVRWWPVGLIDRVRAGIKASSTAN